MPLLQALLVPELQHEQGPKTIAMVPLTALVLLPKTPQGRLLEIAARQGAGAKHVVRPKGLERPPKPRAQRDAETHLAAVEDEGRQLVSESLLEQPFVPAQALELPVPDMRKTVSTNSWSRKGERPSSELAMAAIYILVMRHSGR